MEVETFLSTFPEGKEFTEYLAEFVTWRFPLHSLSRMSRNIPEMMSIIKTVNIWLTSWGRYDASEMSLIHADAA